MKRFAALITALTGSTKTNDKRDALVAYFREAPDADKVWLVALFTGRRPKRIVTSTLLKQWCMEETGIQPWLFEESYHTVGDLGEAIALMLPPPAEEREEVSLTAEMQRIRSLQTADEATKHQFILGQWRSLSKSACFVFNKLITGAFRIGVSDALVIQALAIFLEKESQAVAHTVTGNWDPSLITFDELVGASETTADHSKPYPFYLAYPLEATASNLGGPEEWLVEWKWDGIRGQLIKRNDSLYLWSRGEELITDRFPEIADIQTALPNGVVLDGEILAYRDGQPLSFQYLQTRTTRKTVSKKQLEAAPAVFMVYDVLEWGGEDIRATPMSERRELLEKIVGEIQHPSLVLSPLVSFSEWDALPTLLEAARERGVEGFMLKRKASIYQAGRRRGDWYKWKIDPLSVDAVMIYAQKGHGRRSNLYTDYTFAVRDGDKYVPFAKAYSGLTDKEIALVDKWVKANTVEAFGPVRTVKPELVFEIGFEGISASPRHKSGVAVRFPRMLKWRTDKKAEEVNTLADLKELLAQYGKM